MFLKAKLQLVQEMAVCQVEKQCHDNFSQVFNFIVGDSINCKYSEKLSSTIV